MEIVKSIAARPQLVLWREVALTQVHDLEAPVNPSAFADGKPQVCGQGLEQICLASTIAASG
jgi:hypothetical protein